MKIFLQIILLFSLVGMARGSAASWSDAIHEHASVYSHPYEDPFLSSLRGACRTLGTGYSNMSVPIHNWDAQTPMLHTGSFPTKVGLQTNEHGFAVKAPILVYIPGSFTNLSASQAKRWMWEHTRRGYHVVIVPNPWGTEFINRKPKQPIGNVEAEAATLYDGIRNIISKIKDLGADNGKIRLSGVSSGGYLAAIMMALDAEHQNPLFNMGANTYSVPYNIYDSILALDGMIDEVAPDFDELSYVSLVRKYKDLCSLEHPSDLEDQHLRDSKILVTMVAFHREIIRSVNVYDKIAETNKIPDRSWGVISSKYREWKRNFRFRTYFENFAPDVEKLLQSEKGQIFYWINRAELAGSPGVNILTTDDDFLNAPGIWPKARNIVILKDGGHYGFRHLDWFTSFIDKAYLNNRDLFFQLLYGDSTIPMKPMNSFKSDNSEKLPSSEFRDIFKHGFY